MKSFKELALKKAYSTDLDDNTLFDFYVPILENSIKYDRLAGFFSSSAFSIAAKGIMGLISNHGKMRMIVCPRLTEKDKMAILNSKQNDDKYRLIEEIMTKEIDISEEDFREEPAKALSWMIANEMLELKVAVVYDENGELLTSAQIEQRGIFHQKVGVLYDDYNNILSFSGSVNESASAWLANIEEFKVFRSWVEAEGDFLDSDVQKFRRFWEGDNSRIETMDLPHAVKKRLVENAPSDYEIINWDKYHRKFQRSRIKLFSHQQDAITKWLLNDMCGIFEMATGSGKTLTAFGCYEELEKRRSKFVAVITAPKNHLVRQWLQESFRFGIDSDYLIADGTSKKWKDVLFNKLSDFYMGNINRLIVYTTHVTFSSKCFRNIIANFENKIELFLIADEVHGVGSDKTKLGMDDWYKYRLGLSATPERWFDLEGTNQLYDYFKGTVFSFSLKDAINMTNPMTGLTYLTPYKYNLSFGELSDSELLDYVTLTKKILKSIGNKHNQELEKEQYFQRLLFQRANIIKDAEIKYDILEDILNDMGDNVKWTLIYCSPKQINNVMDILNRRSIISHRFTMNEGTRPSPEINGFSEREHILDYFAKGKYQILVSINCLDEGVDVPPARTAIFMASSGNPREYIQRIGRVVRRYKNKQFANIFDIVIRPRDDFEDPYIFKIENKIFTKELNRCEELASIAANSVEAIHKISQEKARIRGVKL